MTRLAQWTVEKLTRARTPSTRSGSIEVATTDERWAELDRRWARARGYGLEARAARRPRRSPSSCRCSIPSTIVGGLHVADDGIAKAVRAAQAMCRHEAIAAFGDCEVTGLLIEGGRAVGVQTDARHDPRRARRHRRRHLGARAVAALRRGSTCRSCRSSTSSPIRRRCPSSPGRRARSCTRSCATRTTRCTSARSPTPTRSATTATSRAWPIPQRPAELAFTADDFASARARGGPDAAGAARRRDRRAPSTG